MQKTAVLLAFLAAAGVSAKAQEAPPSFDDVVNRAIAQENNLLKILRGQHPVAETYIQELSPDADFGAVPKNDHYFLGKLDLSRGVATDSFMPKEGGGLGAMFRMLSAKYLPVGFAQTLIMDNGAFDRGHYDFEFYRREFLGDVRTYVINVSPKKTAGRGRFIGRIWVEDKEFHIVRFNGTYSLAAFGATFTHFDSWRINCGPDLWVPFATYGEETGSKTGVLTPRLRFKSITRVWGYAPPDDRPESEFSNITVDLPAVQDKSDQAAENSPVESLRAWERQGEENVLDRLEIAHIIAGKGAVEKILDTVVNNLVVTNNLNIFPEVKTRIILTMPIETFTVGHTILISRGLLDTLPDEASLAVVLAHELAHIALGQVIDTKFAFSDRTLFDDDRVLKMFRFARPQAEEDAANAKAMELLQKSPYADKLRQPALFLKALGAESGRLPNLIAPLFGSRMAQNNNVLRMSALLQQAPELQRNRIDQIPALPLGARTMLDPWTSRLRVVTTRVVPLLSAREKMPFEITPVYLHLRYSTIWDTPEHADTAAEGSKP